MSSAVLQVLGIWTNATVCDSKELGALQTQTIVLWQGARREAVGAGGRKGAPKAGCGSLLPGLT